MTQRNVKFQCYLWPDHVISKAESRAIREEHNSLVNSHAELLAALKAMVELAIELGAHHRGEFEQARAAIAKAAGEN